MHGLANKRLVLVAGKGGVGRTTVATAIARAAVRRGRRTLLYQANARDRIGALYDRPPLAEQIVELEPGLFAINTNPHAALREYGLMVLRFERVYKLLFENRVTKYFLRAIPGLDDYAILGKCWYHTTETQPGWDTVVFDMPASGHALSMLRIPSVIVKTVPEGPLRRDARKIRAMLADRNRTALVLVTMAEEMPANEATEFAATTKTELGLPVSHLVINQIYPDRFSPEAAAGRALAHLIDTPPLTDDVSAVVEHAKLQRSRRELNKTYLDMLSTSLPAARIELPYLFAPSIGRSQIDDLAKRLEDSAVSDLAKTGPSAV